MKKHLKKLVALFGLTAMAGAVYAQNRVTFAGTAVAEDFAYGVTASGPAALLVTAGSQTSGTYTVTLAYGQTVTNSGVKFSPITTTTPITIGVGAALETVTPSAVSCSTPTVQYSCQFTATFANAHANGDTVRSGTVGLQEAINYVSGMGGGLVATDGRWFQLGGTAAMVASASQVVTVGIVNNSGGYTNVGAVTLRGSCTGTATSSATLGLLGLGEQAIGTCTSTVVSAGQVMNRPGVLANLAISAGTAGVSTSAGVFTVLKNGSTTTITCTVGTGTSCTDTTHTVTFVAGDIIGVQFTTQATETLAAVKASLTAF